MEAEALESDRAPQRFDRGRVVAPSEDDVREAHVLALETQLAAVDLRGNQEDGDARKHDHDSKLLRQTVNRAP